jgi:hypothetical protein
MTEERPQPPSFLCIHSWQLLGFSPHQIGNWGITVPSCSQDRFKSPLLSRSGSLDSFRESLCKPDPQVLLTFLSASAPSRGGPRLYIGVLGFQLSAVTNHCPRETPITDSPMSASTYWPSRLSSRSYDQSL